jgi:hypothetical protein
MACPSEQQWSTLIYGRRYRHRGSAPYRQAARELGILTIDVVTKPFHFEGQRRMRIAEAGVAELLKVLDILLIIPHQNLFRVASEQTTFANAFALADQVLYSSVIRGRRSGYATQFGSRSTAAMGT